MVISNPIDRSTGTRYNAGTPAAEVSASFTPASLAALIAITFIADTHGSVRSHTITSSLGAIAPDGGGTVWVKKVSIVSSGTYNGYLWELAIWVGKAPVSPGAGTITATPTGSHGSDGWNWATFLEIATGVDFSTFSTWASASAQDVSNASSIPLTLTPSPADSSLYLSVHDLWDAALSTIPTAWTSLTYDSDTSWLNEIASAYRNDGVNGSPHTWTVSPDQRQWAVALEIKAANPGQIVLQSLPFWWDARTYSGSGNLINRGTVASRDLTISGPTFSVDKFTFDGVNDYMTVASHASMDADSTDWFCGVIIKQLSPVTNDGFYIGKRASPGPYWDIATNSTGGTGIKCEFRGSSTPAGEAQINPAGYLTPLKVMLGMKIIGINSTTAYANSTAGTTVTTSRNGSITSSADLWIGTWNNTANWQKFEFYGAFIARTALTVQNIADIVAHYIESVNNVASQSTFFAS